MAVLHDIGNVDRGLLEHPIDAAVKQSGAGAVTDYVSVGGKHSLTLLKAMLGVSMNFSHSLAE